MTTVVTNSFCISTFSAINFASLLHNLDILPLNTTFGSALMTAQPGTMRNAPGVLELQRFALRDSLLRLFC